jgi:outer membrane lipoprotein SlyB
MWNGALLLLTLIWASHAPASLETHSDATLTAASSQRPSCFDGDQPAPARAVRCEQMAAILPLRPVPWQRGGEAMAGATGGAAKGALVGAGIGLGIGLLAGLAFGPSCEEGHAGCTAGIVVGSTALFAIIGAISGASKDGDSKDEPSEDGGTSKQD